MKLTTLRLHGFKSFADRTQIQFHDGITAIVGPNGCGKSNISDAIRWVLGEQRPTAIRGAKMEEAIFQGTVSRRPVHRGSVAMEISNDAGSLPVPFEEVEISRTVYRDGGSEYQLNRSACRLRDIHDLCRDTGLGANAYSVIENRMIDAILSDRAEERRGLFEEAAGIGKYKDRRKAALRRLERAEIDVQRLDDLIAEVQSKVRSLARQKGRAERYRELRKRRLDVEVAVVRAQLEAFGQRLAEIRGILDGGLASTEGLNAEIAAAEARVETLRAEQVEAERGRTAAAARVEELRSELVEWEREMAVAAERASYADRRLEQIGGEREDARARRRQAATEQEELAERATKRDEALARVRSEVAVEEERAAEIRGRLQRARTAMDEVEGREREVARRVAQLHGDADAAEAQARELAVRLEHLDAELDEARTALEELRSQGDLFGDRIEGFESEVGDAATRVAEAEARLARGREALEAAREAELDAADRAGELETRLATLEKMEREREGMDPVLKALLEDPPDGVVGILADSISAAPEVMAAVEAYLGVSSRGVVVRDGAVATEVARWFRDEWSGGGRPRPAAPRSGAGRAPLRIAPGARRGPRGGRAVGAGPPRRRELRGRRLGAGERRGTLRPRVGRRNGRDPTGPRAGRQSPGRDGAAGAQGGAPDAPARGGHGARASRRAEAGPRGGPGRHESRRGGPGRHAGPAAGGRGRLPRGPLPRERAHGPTDPHGAVGRGARAAAGGGAYGAGPGAGEDRRRPCRIGGARGRGRGAA